MKTNKRFIVIGLLVMLLFLLSACGTIATSDQKASQAVDDQQNHYLDVQPIPWFDYSLDRYLMIQLYKSKNNAVQTFSVEWNDYLGTITFSCASIGYPIPGGTELDNPWQVQYYYGSGSGAYSDSGVAIGQAEPNGVFPPGTSAGTYVMCLNPDGTIGPVYMEPSIQTFPYPMMEQDHHLVQVPGSNSSISIPYSPSDIVSASNADKNTVPTPAAP